MFHAEHQIACHPGTLAIDARGLHASGIGRYLRELLAHWLADPPFSTLRLLGDPGVLESFVAGRPSSGTVDIVPYRGGFYSARSQLDWLRRVPSRLGDGGATFFPHWDTPFVGFPARAVMTVHDLIPFKVPETTTATRRGLGWLALRHGIGAAAHVLCGSQATADDLALAFPVSRGKVTVVPYGATRFPDACSARLPLGVERPFVLVVGNQKPHKNIGVAIAAVARARALGHSSLTLVVVGRRFGVPVVAGPDSDPNQPFVVELGEVSDELLTALYARAEALLFPSRYEGFGLPVVEAMAAGTPVIASAIRAVVEVAGDAAMLVPPNDPEAMADAIDCLLRSGERRAELVASGRRRAEAFSWRRTAHDTARVLHAAAGHGERPSPTRDDIARR